ncbi:MAG: response regulator transcription factor [Vicinamibacterales bacterium]
MSGRRRVLLVDDEPNVVFMLTDRLQAEAYEVRSAPDGPTGLAQALADPFDVIVLDGMLPGLDGLDVVRTLRERGVQTPVLMLSARGQVMDRVMGLTLGADDYLMKPFEVSELLARLQALIRRTSRAGLDTCTFGNVSVDIRGAEVTRDGQTVDLTAREFTLLVYFLEHPGATLSRNELLNQVWGYHAMPSTRTVDVHVSMLRQKLEANPRRPAHLRTVFGLGYKFVP